MPKYILLSRVDPEGLSDRGTVEKLNAEIGERVREEVPEARWISNYTVLGPYDFLDVFEAPDNESAAKVALLVRSIGHARTEVWPAMDWERFREDVIREPREESQLRRPRPAATRSGSS